MKTNILLTALLALSGSAYADGLDDLHARMGAITTVDAAAGGVEMFSGKGHVARGVCFAPMTGTFAEAGTLRCSVSGKPSIATPVFHRQDDQNATDWAVDVSASLRRSSWRGNAIFAFYDAADPDAISEDRPAAMYQADIEKSKELFAHVHLSPESGFTAGHTYRMRIAQLIKGETVVLAESDLSLE